MLDGGLELRCSVWATYDGWGGALLLGVTEGEGMFTGVHGGPGDRVAGVAPPVPPQYW